MLERRILGHELVHGRDPHHGRHALLLDQGETPGSVERPLEHHPSSLPPCQQRLDVPAAAVELRQDLEHDVVAVDTRDQIEADIRPEAVCVREQRSLRASGRARGVDQEQRIVGCRRARRPRRRLSVGSHGCELERLVGELGVLVLGEEHGGVGVVQLVRDLARRQAPRDRGEDRARLRTGEEEGDVLRCVAGQRRDPVSMRERACELVRTRFELVERNVAAVVVNRDAMRREPGAVPDPAIDGEGDHPRNSVTRLTNLPGSCQKNR